MRAALLGALLAAGLGGCSYGTMTRAEAPQQRCDRFDPDDKIARRCWGAGDPDQEELDRRDAVEDALRNSGHTMVGAPGASDDAGASPQ